MRWLLILCLMDCGSNVRATRYGTQTALPSDCAVEHLTQTRARLRQVGVICSAADTSAIEIDSAVCELGGTITVEAGTCTLGRSTGRERTVYLNEQ